MIKEIITYPNPILRKKSKDVEVFDKELHTLLDDMNDTMMQCGGVGLAAIQIAVPLNVLIINIPVEDYGEDDDGEQNPENLIEAINPVITHKDGEQVFNEGCLSIPGFNAEVTRAEHVIVEYYNRFGEKQTIEANDFLAVAWQHEMEHLSGHVFIENLSFLKRKKFEKEWKRQLKENKKRKL
ncbi:MAG: peptide deformylase [Campylobacterota bacterium]|nr:peptide deformylase [Campylobacterota bacterium]